MWRVAVCIGSIAVGYRLADPQEVGNAPGALISSNGTKTSCTNRINTALGSQSSTNSKSKIRWNQFLENPHQYSDTTADTEFGFIRYSKATWRAKIIKTDTELGRVLKNLKDCFSGSSCTNADFQSKAERIFNTKDNGDLWEDNKDWWTKAGAVVDKMYDEFNINGLCYFVPARHTCPVKDCCEIRQAASVAHEQRADGRLKINLQTGWLRNCGVGTLLHEFTHHMKVGGVKISHNQNNGYVDLLRNAYKWGEAARLVDVDNNVKIEEFKIEEFDDEDVVF